MITDLTPERFSECLQHVLTLRGLTYNELALRSGVNVTQIAHYATGKRLPSTKNLHRLACALDVGPDVLMGNDMMHVNAIKAPPRMVTLLEQASRLTSTQMDLLLGIVNLMVKQKES